MSAILPGIVEEAERLLDAASADGTTLSLLGGVAVRLKASDVPASLDREYKDIDFAVPKKGAGDAEKLMREAGYEPHVAFNAMHARERALFYDDEHGRQVDMFIESFRMCHQIPLGDRLRLEDRTVPLAELLLTKLQIIELNEKDVRDTVALLLEHDVTDDDAGVNATHVAALCAEDWGLWRTISHNLETLRGRLDAYDVDREAVANRVSAILERIEAAPKSRGWRMRAKIGERKRWYELPEEV
jgi:hypothetical protein